MDARRKILVIDDAPMFLELESLFLARTGQVITAGDGPEGLDAARRERPAVVVADLDMRRMHGDDVCRRIKADPALRGTHVILVTGSDRPADRARAVRAGADDVLPKPLSRVSLIRAVNRLLRFPATRGLARVPLDAPVRIHRAREDALGQARNLSRGGMFVETDYDAPLDAEVELCFELPGAPAALVPTAKVVWHGRGSGTLPEGLGLQFLALDRPSSRWIDDFVYERASFESAPAPLVAEPSGR